MTYGGSQIGGQGKNMTTYTLDQFNTAHNVRTGLLRLVRCSSFREHKDFVLRLLLCLTRKSVTALRNSSTTVSRRSLDDKFVRSVR